MIRKSASNKYYTNCKNNKLLFITIFTIICLKQAEAKRVTLVPLTGPRVYQLLRQNKFLDAVPEGRVVTQGIAAVSGFTLGLKKAVGAALLYDIITANITEADAQASTEPVYLTQEVCFSSRNARNLDEAEAIAEAYSRLEERDTQLQATVRKSQEKRRFTPKRKTKRKFKNKLKNKVPPRINILKTYPHTATSILTTNPSTSLKVAEISTVGTQSTQPAATNTASGGGVDTNINAATGSDVTSSTTTSSDNNTNSVTCIVIQKPKP